MGEKVKKLAVIYLVLGLAIGIIGILSSLGGLDDVDLIKYSTLFGGAGYSFEILEESGNEALAAIFKISASVVLIITSIVTYIPLAAFGELVEDTAETKMYLKDMQERLDKAELEKLELMKQINSSLNVINGKISNDNNME